jgi:Family of unknown function (DUF6236)
MESYIGLYYPFIHFPSDDWVKLAALYWHGMARIVPEGYPTRDSDTVSELGDFVQNLAPTDISGVGQEFATVVVQHESELRKRYGVNQAYAWKPDPVTLERMRQAGEPQESSPPGLAYIHRAKLSPDLREKLVGTELAVPTRNDDPAWIGVHPDVARVYMTALAEDMASDDRLRPVSGDPLDHVAISGWTVERLAAALLKEPGIVSPTAPKHEPETALAFIAMETVVPTDLGGIPVEHILEIRRDYTNHMVRFQEALEHAAADLVGDEIQAPKMWRAHIQSVYDTKVRPELDELRSDLSSLGMKTALGAVDMKVTAPDVLSASLVAAGIAVNPMLAIGAGIAVGLVRVGYSYGEQKREILKASDMAYLHLLEQRLQPASLMQRIKRRVKRFLPARSAQAG